MGIELTTQVTRITGLSAGEVKQEGGAKFFNASIDSEDALGSMHYGKITIYGEEDEATAVRNYILSLIEADAKKGK